MRTTLALLLACGLAAAPAAHAASWDESLDGDLSGARLAPTSLALDAGVNSLAGSTAAGDLDYIHFSAPATISSLVLTHFASEDEIAFIALQAGTTFTEPNFGADPSELLGWTHFGPQTPGLPGSDLLPVLGAADPAIGFSGPLPAGDYTFWIQQTGPSPTSYRFELTVVEPLASSFVLLALAGLWARRARARARP